jgi:hypothetical protein
MPKQLIQPLSQSQSQSSSTVPYAVAGTDENTNTWNQTCTSTSSYTKPLAPHLRPSLAFPSSAVLQQASFLLQQQQYDAKSKIQQGLLDEDSLTLPEKQWDSVSSNAMKQTTTYTSLQPSTRSTAINADSLLVANIPLPDRFTVGASEHYKVNHPAKVQSALYRTSNHSYGQHPPSESELPKAYFGNAHNFSKTFNGGMYKDAGLVTAMAKSKVNGNGANRLGFGLS